MNKNFNIFHIFNFCLFSLTFIQGKKNQIVFKTILKKMDLKKEV